MSGHPEADLDQFFLDSFVPISNPTIGTQYDSCNIEDILAFTCPTPRLGYLLPKVHSTMLWTDFLINQWPSQRVRDALNSIKLAISTPGWEPDLLVKLMPDLDVAFFKGRLRTHVQVSWEDSHTMLHLQHPASDFANSLGVTLFDGVNKTCYIRLNRNRVCHEPDPREVMLQTLVHEMVVSKSSTRPSENCTHSGPARMGVSLLPPRSTGLHRLLQGMGVLPRMALAVDFESH